MEILEAAVAAGARAAAVARLLGVGLTTLQRWRRQFASDGDGVDRRKGSHRHVAHRLSEEERQRILLTCNEPEFAALPPGQIVPVLADRGLYIGSKSCFYRVPPTVRFKGGVGPGPKYCCSQIFFGSVAAQAHPAVSITPHWRDFLMHRAYPSILQDQRSLPCGICRV